ncbi:MAG TPA: potassium channel family protein [Acidimicrobiales bacterium]|nr:potassium channel family protein [Acidimicrobiales bacterium]
MPGLGRSESTYDHFSAAVELPLTVLAVVWLPVLVVPYAVHLTPAAADTCAAIDYLVWALFVIEYLTKLYLSPSRSGFVRHHIFDLAVVAVPVLRPLRVLRLVRLFDLGRVGIVLANGLRRARLMLTHKSLHYVLLAVLVLVFALAALELGFEQHTRGATIHNYGDALWWAVVTVTTVGYGDKYPVSAGGRGVAVVLMLVGIGLVGVLTATIASFFVHEKADRDKQELNDRLERIEGMLGEVLAQSGKHGRGGTPYEVAIDPASEPAEANGGQ